MRRTTSSTTMPSSTSTRYSAKSPPLLSPRQMRKVRSAIAALELFERGIGDIGKLLRRIGPLFLAHDHAVDAFLDDHIDLSPLRLLARMIESGVGAAAFLAEQRRARHRLGSGEQRAQRQG